MKRTIGSLTALLVLVLLVTGCGGGTSEPANGDQDSQEAADSADAADTQDVPGEAETADGDSELAEASETPEADSADAESVADAESADTEDADSAETDHESDSESEPCGCEPYLGDFCNATEGASDICAPLDRIDVISVSAETGVCGVHLSAQSDYTELENADMTGASCPSLLQSVDHEFSLVYSAAHDSAVVTYNHLAEPCSRTFSKAACPAVHCQNGHQDYDETGDDCGGSCPSCAIGQPCKTGADCTSYVCRGGTCEDSVCGDGLQEGSESCDDGNRAAGDGCDGSCHVESGYLCPTPGQPCVPACASDADCAAKNSPCTMGACKMGLCLSIPLEEGNSPSQVAGDCRAIHCDGHGLASEVIDDNDVPADDGNACTSESCSLGVPQHLPQPLGTACGQNNQWLCNGAGSCMPTP